MTKQIEKSSKKPRTDKALTINQMIAIFREVIESPPAKKEG